MAFENYRKKCIGFALYRLKLTSDETEGVVPLDRKFVKGTFVVATPEEAQAVAIYGQIYGKRGIVHLAVRTETGEYIHRPRYEASPEVVNEEEIKADRSHSTSIKELRNGKLVNVTPPEHKVFLKLKR